MAMEDIPPNLGFCRRPARRDNSWRSEAYGRDTADTHFTWEKVPEALGLLPEIGALLGPPGARPRWCELYDTGAGRLTKRHPRFEELVPLAGKFIPPVSR